jgi:hypothetical protein
MLGDSLVEATYRAESQGEADTESRNGQECCTQGVCKYAKRQG